MALQFLFTNHCHHARNTKWSTSERSRQSNTACTSSCQKLSHMLVTSCSLVIQSLLESPGNIPLAKDEYLGASKSNYPKNENIWTTIGNLHKKKNTLESISARGTYWRTVLSLWSNVWRTICCCEAIIFPGIKIEYWFHVEPTLGSVSRRINQISR